MRFRNTWSMPACSTSRAVFFTGRFPFRTNVYGALGPDDLANSQVSPFEMTAPKLLKQRGYKSALFGKFHLGLQANNPYRLRDARARSAGTTSPAGWTRPAIRPRSTPRAGGVAAAGHVDAAASCRRQRRGGADHGACYCATALPAHDDRRRDPARPHLPRQGGIFDPGRSCSRRRRPTRLLTLNAHYVSPLVINHADGTVEQVPPHRHPRARTYPRHVAGRRGDRVDQAARPKHSRGWRP